MSTTTAAAHPRWWRSAGVAWLVLTSVAIAVNAPMPYLAGSLSELAARGSETATNYLIRPAWVQIAFYIHVVFGGLALLLSPIQLAGRVRARVPRVHRMVGRVVLGSICIAGSAGLVLSTVDLAGAVGTAGFGTLAVLWITFALLGLRAIRRGDVATHRRWMLRTFAMTCAAVTLRLWLLLLVPVMGGDFRAAYLIVPFLCWVPNLAVAELILRRQRSGEPARSSNRCAEQAHPDVMRMLTATPSGTPQPARTRPTDNIAALGA
jgi:uncharacterized membrane protein